jgi:hypothetical protein
MSYESRFNTHEQLMSRMAAANGADLELAMQTGALAPEGYEAAVHKCTGCNDADGCRSFLQDGRSGMPDFCRNQDLILRFSEDAPSPE